MATAAALFRLAPPGERDVRVDVPLEQHPNVSPVAAAAIDAGALWQRALTGAATLQLSDDRVAFLFQTALRTLILHTPGEVFAGPYTYKRFWFRDAVQIAHALMCVGLVPRARAVLDTSVPVRTTPGISTRRKASGIRTDRYCGRSSGFAS